MGHPSDGAIPPFQGWYPFHGQNPGLRLTALPWATRMAGPLGLEDCLGAGAWSNGLRTVRRGAWHLWESS